MRALAEFIMRGRTQAVGAALLGSLIPLLAPATVALVTLRRGPSEGLWVLLWGLLPVVIMLALQSAGAPLTLVGVLAVYGGATLLRTSASWRHTLMGMVAINTLGALLLGLLAPERVALLVETLSDFIAQLQQQAPEPLPLPAVDATLVLGLAAALISLSSILGLILGRWWQALLYNPGGFASEFRALRLGPVEALVCAAAVGYCSLQPGNYGGWQVVFMLPLVFAGIALVHGLAAQRNLALPWLVAFYVMLVVLQPLYTMLAALAFVDTWLNFRGRKRQQPPVDPHDN